jgi:hypothetical protein
MVERDELLICPVIRGAGCCADASSAHHKRKNAQPADNAEDRSEPKGRMFSLLAEARVTFMGAIFSEIPSCVNSFCAGHGRPAPIAGRSRRIIFAWLISVWYWTPTWPAINLNPSAATEYAAISLSSTGIAGRSGAARHFSTNPPRDLRCVCANGGFDRFSLWFVLLACIRTHRRGGEKQICATVLDKRLLAERATIKL